MKKPSKKIRIILIVIASFLALVSIFIYNGFYNLNNLPKGDFIKEVRSPNGDYTIKAYVAEGTLSAPSVRAEVVNNRETKSVKTIYWEYRKIDADIRWLNNNTIIINNHELNVLRDTFDWRRHDYKPDESPKLKIPKEEYYDEKFERLEDSGT